MPVILLAGAPTNVVKPFTFIFECLNILDIFLFDPETILAFRFSSLFLKFWKKVCRSYPVSRRKHQWSQWNIALFYRLLQYLPSRLSWWKRPVSPSEDGRLKLPWMAVFWYKKIPPPHFSQKTFDGKDIALRYCKLLHQTKKKRRIFKKARLCWMRRILKAVQYTWYILCFSTNKALPCFF